MPWLNDNVYYVIHTDSEQMVSNKLKTMSINDCDINYIRTIYNINGFSFKLFNFRLDLDDSQKTKINEVFKTVDTSAEMSLFITHPKTRLPENQSRNCVTTKMLTAFHGKFLKYLSLEDILSLEMANIEHDLCYDVDLDHDIHTYLRNQIPELYTGTGFFSWQLQDFQINDVLRYSIQKYHDRIRKVFISNILPTNEMNALSSSYNVELDYHKITHIDFKPTNKFDTIEFCAIYHFDPSHTFFFNYDPNYATENYSLNFHTDDSLDCLPCSTNFSNLVIKSLNNHSPQKIDSILMWLSNHFKGSENDPQLILYEFDLNSASRQALGCLLQLINRGWLTLEKMNFNSKTLAKVLEESEQNRLMFKKCQIDIADVELSLNSSSITVLTFMDMDIELNLLSHLKNIDSLELRNCRISSSDGCSRPNNVQIADNVVFERCSVDILSLLRFTNWLQYSRVLTFMFCDLTSCDLVNETYCTRSVIEFKNMTFKSATLFQFIQNCDVEPQNVIIFENCNFQFGNNVFHKVALKPVTIEIKLTKFDQYTLITFLESLHFNSTVSIFNCNILPLVDEQVAISNRHIQLRFVRFIRCRLATYSLINILDNVSEPTEVNFNGCEILPSSQPYPKSLTNQLTAIYFRNVSFSLSILFTILQTLKQNSQITFRMCHISVNNDLPPLLKLQPKIQIHFRDMTVETEIGQRLLETDAIIIFSNCRLMFMIDEVLNISPESNVMFRHMTFDLAAHLKALAYFKPSSVVEFQHCHFTIENSVAFNIVIKPVLIKFERTTFDLEALVTILEVISAETTVILSKCGIQSITDIFSIRPIKITALAFESMNLEMDTVLRIVKNFGSESQLLFADCNLHGSNQTELSTTKLKSVTFADMTIDLQIFLTFMQNYTNEVTVSFNKCTIVPLDSRDASHGTLKIKYLLFITATHSRGYLQLLQHLNEDCIVNYMGQLTSQAIVEICTQSPIYGKRLQLMAQTSMNAICFELFAEFYRSKAFSLKLDTNEEYDPPTHLIPFSVSMLFGKQYDWDAVKIKLVLVNEASVKIEFLKNGQPIDLFYELNNLADGLDECLIDYY